MFLLAGEGYCVTPPEQGSVKKLKSSGIEGLGVNGKGSKDDRSPNFRKRWENFDRIDWRKRDEQEKV